MDQFVQQSLHRLVGNPADINTSLHALPGLLSHPSSLPVLSPKAFFVAFHGTLTLAFAGWPSCVCERKARMDAELCAHAQVLTQENPGTRWPKVTLGVLEEGVKLGKDEAHKLLGVISSLNKELLGDCKAEEILDAFDIVLFDVSFFSCKYTLSTKNILETFSRL